MTPFLMGIRDNIPEDCISNRCGKSGCNVDLSDSPSPHLIVDLDCCKIPLIADQSRPDYLFFGHLGEDGCLVVALELKRGDARLRIAEQLRGGSRLAEKLVACVSAQPRVRFCPVGVYGGRLHRDVRKKLRKAKIAFRGVAHPIKLLRCGRRLSLVV